MIASEVITLGTVPWLGPSTEAVEAESNGKQMTS
jgi:hypothetical protein